MSIEQKENPRGQKDRHKGKTSREEKDKTL